jgi:class 3 adenylate cyclase
MGRQSDDLYKKLFGLNDEPSGLNYLRRLSLPPLEPSPANSIFDWIGKSSEDRPLNNLRSLADLGRRISALPSSPPPANLLTNLSGGSIFGDPVFRAPIPVEKPTGPPAPAAPGMDFIRSFVSAMANKKVHVKDGRVMPSIDDIAIMEGRRVNAAFVYSDLHGFTKLVATQPENKSFVFLHTFVEIASRLTKHYGGQVVDCAGDRVLSVFHRSPGDYSVDPVHDAVTFALFLQTAFSRVIGPSFAAGLGQLSVGIGIDYGPAVVGCVGIRSNKRIVFFGDAANKAAKLQEKAGAGETILSYDADIRKPAYLESTNGWTLQRETIEDGSTILRTTCIFKEDKLVKVR